MGRHAPVTDAIEISGIRVFGRHGANAGEKDVPQPFDVDVRLDIDLSAARRSDALADTLDYGSHTPQSLRSSRSVSTICSSGWATSCCCDAAGRYAGDQRNRAHRQTRAAGGRDAGRHRPRRTVAMTLAHIGLVQTSATGASPRGGSPPGGSRRITAVIAVSHARGGRLISRRSSMPVVALQTDCDPHGLLPGSKPRSRAGRTADVPLGAADDRPRRPHLATCGWRS